MITIPKIIQWNQTLKVMIYMKARKIIVPAGFLAISLLIITACNVIRTAESSRLVENATVMDVDGNTYTTIRAGNQIWMADILNKRLMP